MNKDSTIKPKAIFQLLKNTGVYFSLVRVFYVKNELNLIPAPSHKLRVQRRNQPQKCQTQCKCKEAYSYRSHSCGSRSHVLCNSQFNRMTQKAQLNIPKQFLLDISYLCWEADNIENITQHAWIFKVFDSLFMKGSMMDKIFSFSSKSFNDFPG